MPYQQVFRHDLDLVYSRFGAAVEVDPVLRFDTIREIRQSQSTWIRQVRGDADAVLVGAGDLAFGLIRTYASLAVTDSQRFSPCREWEAACDLLAIDPTINLLADAANG